MSKGKRYIIGYQSDDAATDFDFSSTVAEHGGDPQKVAAQRAALLRRRALQALLGSTPEGNIGLLRDPMGKLEDSVTSQTAQDYSGRGERQIQKLVKSRHLKTVGRGISKRIKVDSLLECFPPARLADRQTGPRPEIHDITDDVPDRWRYRFLGVEAPIERKSKPAHPPKREPN